MVNAQLQCTRLTFAQLGSEFRAPIEARKGLCWAILAAVSMQLTGDEGCKPRKLGPVSQMPLERRYENFGSHVDWLFRITSPLILPNFGTLTTDLITVKTMKGSHRPFWSSLAYLTLCMMLLLGADIDSVCHYDSPKSPKISKWVCSV